MRQPAGGQQVNTGGGNLAGRVWRDTAGGFGQNMAVHHAHGLGELLGRHVVQQHRVNAARQRLFELCEGVHLDLHLHQMPHRRVHPPNGLGDTAGHDEVIVLDEHGVVQSEAVIGATTAAHGVFLQHPQTGGGFAGANDARGIALHGLHQALGGAGDAGKASQKVERNAFGTQQATR